MAVEYLSVEDVATALGFHRKTVERYIRNGALKAVKIGQMYRIKRTDLDAWLGEGEDEAQQGCQVIAVTNHKGGVGKTTTCINLAASLAQLHYRVLLVDLDPQASLTLHLGFIPDKLERTVYTALQAAAKRAPYDYQRLLLDAGGGISLMPANLELSGFDITMNHVLNREHLVKSVIEALKAEYDFVIFDCGPSISLLTINALTAADWVLVPVEAEFLAVRGISLLMETIEEVQSTTNRNLKIVGILITKYDARGNVTRDLVANVREAYGRHIHVFKTVIPRALRVVESSVEGKSVVSFDPESLPAQAYLQFAQQLLAQVGMQDEDAGSSEGEGEGAPTPLRLPERAESVGAAVANGRAKRVVRRAGSSHA
jgi:chromosome partitioning protein